MREVSRSAALDRSKLLEGRIVPRTPQASLKEDQGASLDFRPLCRLGRAVSHGMSPAEGLTMHRAAFFVGFALLVACGAAEPDGQGDTTTALRAVPCISGAACACSSLVQGKYECTTSGKVKACKCDDGTTKPLEPANDPSPIPEADASPPSATPVENLPGDTCTPQSLGSLGPRVIARGAPVLFAVELAGTSDTFKSGCVRADGPDRVQPIRADSTGEMFVTLKTVVGLSGSPVLYAKAKCDDAKDLACDYQENKIHFPVKAGTTYFVHFDGTSPTVAPGARITALAEIQ